jgi:uncharacterized protein involved in exopolysaccharide biosynthesis
MNNQRTPVYTASADILIARLSSNIELDDRVSTSSASMQTDQNGWRTSLLQLASSSVVANVVLEELEEDLPALYRSPDALIAMIAATNPLSEDERFASNLIRISATSEDPEVAALVANSWARHLIDYINGLYGEVPESMIESVRAERDQALLDYQAAEKAYEEFVASSQIAVLTRQIQEKTLLRDAILANYSTLLTAVVNTEYTASVNLYTTLANASVEHASAVIAAQSAGTMKSLDRLYTLHASAIAQLNQARIMERSLVDGGEAAAKSNNAALRLLKLSSFAALYGDDLSSANLPYAELSPAVEMTLEEQLTDVRALASVLEGHIAELKDEIEELSTSGMIGANLEAVADLGNEGSLPAGSAESTSAADAEAAYSELLGPDGILNLSNAPEALRAAAGDSHEAMLTTLEAEIRELQAVMSGEEARQRELTHQRDLAWTTYETVGNKLQELSLLRSSANSEVRLGNPALVPVAPLPRGSSMLLVAAITLFVFFLAVILALLVDTLGGEPFLARRTA